MYSDSGHSLAELNPPHTLMAIPSGVAGTLATLKLMWLLVRQGKTSVPVRMMAVRLTNGNLQKDYRREIDAVYRFVRDEIRYVRDVQGTETLHTAEQILKQRAGDCDDKSILLAAMLGAIGFKTRLVAVGFKPGQYQHVFVEVKLGKSWIPLETTEPVDMGWQFPIKPIMRLVYPPMPS